MLAALNAAGYEYPTPIQAGVIPRAVAGVDVIGQARTGTGKTASFVIPILEKVEIGKGHEPQALVMVPTRELAVQVADEVDKLSLGQRIHCVAVYGGKPIRGQIDKIRKGVDVIVGTPGRVLDHLARGTLNLSSLKIVVLDEADRMLDIGFRPDIEKILRRCPASRQTLLLSATVPPPIAKLCERYMRDPETLNFSPKEISVDTIEQMYFTVEHDRKYDLLVRLLVRERPKQVIIFCRTKRGVEKVYQRLRRRIPEIGCMHGDMTQGARDRVMAAFRAQKLPLLVATDVVGRGIDVSTVSHIINYDIPSYSDDYVHRVGRTGRMGREGIAFTFVCPDEGLELTKIEERINRLLKRDEIRDFEAVAMKAVPPQATVDGDGQVTPPADAPPKPEVANSLKKRPQKRYRRAL